MDTHSLCFAKGQRIIFIYFFVIERRSDTILIEKSHYFVFFGVCIYIYLACQFIKKKDWQATGFVYTNPKKVHLAHFV